MSNNVFAALPSSRIAGQINAANRRVFQRYLQYVELSPQGCSILRHKVQVPQGILDLTPSKTVRERLLALNQARAAEEAASLPTKPKRGKKKTSDDGAGTIGLFSEES